MIELTKTELESLIADIAGSTTTINDGIEGLGYDPDDIGLATLEEIDSRVFECGVCGWTCWRDEESAVEGTCDECEDDEDEEEE